MIQCGYHASLPDHDKQCMDSRNYLVAHYNLKSPEKPAINTSGNIMTIYEPYAHLAIGKSLFIDM